MFLTTNRLVSLLFFVLLFGAAFFAVERILFADASFILFRIINSDNLQIQEHRYGSFVTQIFPLLGAKLRLPLATIVLLYSTSFTLFYLVVAVLLLYRFKEQQLAVLMSFYFLLFVSDTWFWMNNEVHQGIAWMFLFFAVVHWLGRRKTHWFICYTLFVLLAFLTLFTHPVLLFPTSFLWLFFVSRKDLPFSRSQVLLFSGILVFLAIIKLYLSTGSSSHYDAEKLENIRNLSLEDLIKVFQSPLTKGLVKETVRNYWIILPLIIVGLATTWKKKEWQIMTLTVTYTLIYFIALGITFQDFLPFYTESELMPATIFLTTPFVYYVLPQLKTKYQVLLLATIFLVRLSYIGFAAQTWTDRKNWLMATLDTMRRQQITKGLIYETDANKKQLLLNWGTPCESLIASALRGEKVQQTFVVDKPEALANRLPVENRYMIGSFEILPISSLNAHYFRFDTTAGYTLLNGIPK